MVDQLLAVQLFKVFALWLSRLLREIKPEHTSLLPLDTTGSDKCPISFIRGRFIRPLFSAGSTALREPLNHER